MPTTSCNGVRLQWAEKGSGSPLLLIMGHRYSSRLWYPALDVLAQRHRVIYFDNRGTGGSGYSLSVTIPELARDALAIMDAAGVKQAHVYGVSMGGCIAQELALLQPERVLSLSLGCTALWSRETIKITWMLRALYYLPPALLRLMLSRSRGGDLVYGSRATPEAIKRDRAMVDSDPHTLLGLAAQAGALANYVGDRERIARLAMPVQVLHGTEDSVVLYRHGQDLAKVLGCELITFNGAGHNYYVAAAVEANQAMLDFLERVENRIPA